MHISANRYLEEEIFCFTKVTENNEKINKNGKKAEMAPDSKEKTRKKGFTQRKERHISFIV